MALGPLPVGGTLFAGGGGNAGASPSSSVNFQSTPGATKAGPKNSVQQNLHSPHSGMSSSITSGDPFSRSMSQYGKGHSYNSGLGGIRGGMGQMRRIRGGLGPGKTGQAGGSNDYSMASPDSE